jgi:hypothetical protein
MTDTAIRARERGGRQWLRVFSGGLLLWAASVLVTFWTANANLVPTVILLGSFLVPATFVVYAFERHADRVLTSRQIFTRSGPSGGRCGPRATTSSSTRPRRASSAASCSWARTWTPSTSRRPTTGAC